MTRTAKEKQGLRSLFAFSRRERRGILWLLPLLAVAGLLAFFAARPSFERSFLDPPGEGAARLPGAGVAAHEIGESDGDRAGLSASAELFAFDPNTVTLQELCRLGFTTKTAAGIIKYREKGKRFEIPEDFATCYGVSLEHYSLLEPYIVIGDEYRARPRTGSGAAGRGRESAAHIPPGSLIEAFDPNALDVAAFTSLGFSERQAQVIVKYRETIGGFKSKEDFARCYVVSPERFEQLEPFMIVGLSALGAGEAGGGSERGAAGRGAAVVVVVELNGADSAALRSVSGIGEVLVGRIMEYRRRLGGFVRREQLAEIEGMTEANYERICTQIRIDSCVIQKIDVNFASHKNLVGRLGEHPYATDRMIRKLLKERQLKGGWSNCEEMVEQNIMTREEAERLSPYLLFTKPERY